MNMELMLSRGVLVICFELYDPQDYDVKYAARRFDDLPIKTPRRLREKYKIRADAQQQTNIIFLSSRKRPVSFMPETRTMKAACWLMKF